MTPPLPVTEDTPADMLAGSMDLELILPSGEKKRCSVFRSTPMMDLLVQVTTAHRLSPGSHTLEAIGPKGPLRFQPSTPIGALDTLTIRIIGKKSANLKKAPQVPQFLPQTFRLTVHLPRSQLFVLRVTPSVPISDVMKQVCEEKNLNPLKYELRVTGLLDQPLKLDERIGSLNTQDLTLVVRGTDHLRHNMSSADIIQVKQANNRQTSLCDSSLSSGSLESRSISPVAMPAPQPPQRKKRRPAPKPPDAQIRSVVISHSRESSDSSGYHEPSTLSDSPTHGGPPMDISNRTNQRQNGLSVMTGRNSQSMSNLTHIPPGKLRSSESISSLSSNGVTKKKKAPPPPPIQKPIVINGNDSKTKAATLPATARHFVEPEKVAPVPPPPASVRDLGEPEKESPVPPPPVSVRHLGEPEKVAPVPPPPPVELAPSPPISPEDTYTPTPQPRLSITSEPQVPSRSSRRFDQDDEEPKPVVRKNLRGSRSSNDLYVRKIVPKIQKTYSDGDVLRNVDSEDGDGETPSSFDSSEQETDGQPDSLSVDWQYQLPPPPSHFRDMIVPSTPTPTEGATLGTFDTRDMLEEDKKSIEIDEVDKCKIYEDHETEVKVIEKIELNGEQKIMRRKMDVMNELTNILDRNKLFEKSQSVNNLSSIPELKGKSHTLHSSQSFATPLIPNFKIAEYESRTSKTAEDVEFRVPAKPIESRKIVRRADSMNVKDAGNMDVLKQKFLQFLREKKDIEAAADLEDIDMTSLLPETIEEARVEDEVVKVEKEEEKISNVTTISTEALNGPVNVTPPSMVEPKINRNCWVPPTPPPSVKAAPKRSSWQPPSVSLGTWGERPKTKILIKDTDYTSEVIEVPEKRPVEVKQTFPKHEPLRPVAERKPVSFKKPTNYELFSALSRRRDSPEPEEVEKEEETRPPVVCAVELKKEFRSEPDLVKDLQPDVPKSSKVYVNGTPWTSDAQYSTKGRPVGLMPVVKGFRNIQQVEKKPDIVKQASVPDLRQSVQSVKRQESCPAPSIVTKQEPVGIPPPPPMNSIKLKPVSQRQIQAKIPEDGRGLLLEEIRNFGGTSRLKKTAR